MSLKLMHEKNTNPFEPPVGDTSQSSPKARTLLTRSRVTWPGVALIAFSLFAFLIAELFRPHPKISQPSDNYYFAILLMGLLALIVGLVALIVGPMLSASAPKPTHSAQKHDKH